MSTYDIVLAERFTFRRADELDQAIERTKLARLKVDEAIREFNEDRHNKLMSYGSRIKRELNELESDQIDIQDQVAALAESDISEAARLIRHTYNRNKARIALSEARIKEIDQDHERALQRVEPSDSVTVQTAIHAKVEAEEGLLSLQRQVPSGRKAYQLSERLIDFFRLFPPPVTGILALGWPIFGQWLSKGFI